jgi:DNA-binding MarR family transcriptional regulator
MQDAEQLRIAVGRFVRRIREDDAIPAGQSAVLGHLDRDGELPITELAQRERVRHQSMTQTLKLLQSQELIELISDDKDRRRVLARITAAGRGIIDADRQNRAGRIAQTILDELTPDEQEIVSRIPAILLKLT